MTDRAYRRSSRDTQSTERQAHLLKAEGFGEPDGITVFEDPATSSKIPALERDGFKALAAVTVAGDTIKVSELFRLCRDLEDVIAVTKWCRARQISLRVLSGALSNIVDLAASDSTTVMYVGILASVGQFHRDLQNELTRDGLHAANAAGRHGGRRPAVKDVEAVRKDYAEGDGMSIKALAERYGVSRGAIRTALNIGPRRAQGAAEQPEEVAEPHVIVEMPGKVADFLREEGTAPMEAGTFTRRALEQAETIRRGGGYTLRVLAPLEVHRELLRAADVLAGQGVEATAAEVRAYRTYAKRIDDATSTI